MAETARELVLDIYDTVVDASLWPGVLEKFAARIGALGCIVFEWRGEGDARRLAAPLFSSGYDPALIQGDLQGIRNLM